MDQHSGGKWLIHDTKRRKDNQLQSLKLPCRISKFIATMISTVKFERNNRPFTIEDILKGEFNWIHVWNYTAVLCYKYMYIVPITF